MAAERHFPLRASRALPLSGAALVIAAGTAMFSDAGALALGWLAAWLFLISIPVGASVWLLIGSLTGGRWRAAVAPVLMPLSAATWAVALAGILFVAAGPVLYPWWTDEAQPALWFDPALFGARAALVLILWSLMGFLARRDLPPLAAGLLLVAHGFAVSVAGVDWVLSLDPAFVSTAFGAHLAVLQLALALAVAAMAGAADARGDIGGLMLACVLGVLYLGGMEFIVSWSGNLPHKAAWYLARQDAAGLTVMWLSFVIGILGPFCVLLLTRARRSAATLRPVGAAMLAGGALHVVWLTAAGRMAPAALIALALAIAVAALATIWRARHE